MPLQKLTISLFTADTGHLSIAEAISAYLKPQYIVHTNNVTGSGFDLYYPFYRYFPQLFKIPYQLSQRRQAIRLINKFVDKTYRQNIEQLLNTQKPQVVISTWYLPNQILENYCRRHRLPMVNIFTDPRTFHNLIPSRFAQNFVFDSQAADRCQNLSLPKKLVTVSGWFTRPNYQPVSQISALRRRLNLPPNTFTCLVAAGSEGTNLILKIIPTFLQSPAPVTVIVACGHNQRLFQAIQYLDQANRQLRPRAPARLLPITFTRDLHQYMQASNLVIGKAGPNLLFESTACQVPFFAITHISGQEDGNLDIIKEYQLGYVEENPVKANRLLKSLLSQPEKLTDFKPALTRLAAHNANAPAILLQHLRSLATIPAK